MSAKWFLVPLALACLALMPACRKDDSPAADTSQATLVLTDAATDDLDLFEVDVTGVVFHKYSGADVSVLAKATRVDFVSLEDVGELVVGTGLEAGYYTGMTMTLDFTNALAYVKGSTTPAALLDSDGSALTGTVQLNIDFSQGDRPYVTKGRNHLFMLDLNLDQAISVNTGQNEVTFTPVVTVEVDPTNPKSIIATGFMTAADASAGTFTVEKKANDGSTIGSFTVSVASTTTYHVDGAAYTGPSGLTALAAMTMGTTRVWVRGVVDTVERVLQASTVEAGAGTFGSGQDWVEGLVVARDNGAGSDASLTVLGTSKDVSTGTRTFNTSHTVNVSFANTGVIERDSAVTLDTDSISIGQRIVAFGTLAGVTLDASTTSGVVRLVRSDVYGYAAGAPVGNVLTLNVVRFGLRDVGLFNFTVGGTPEAVPTAYTVNVTGLDATGITINSRIRAIGCVNPLGSATTEFTAVSLVNRNDSARLLTCGWVPPAVVSPLTCTYLGILTDVTGANWKLVDDGFAGTVTLLNSPAPRIVPKYAYGIYVIYENQGIQVHYTFAPFIDSLNSRITTTSCVARIGALGSFDLGTQIFSASVIVVVLD